ncbi:MAG: hypothetical protein OEW11_04465 [Nitrospirota bacterium]|nr:hypothetical protein [Nitrospirota bacterium]
MMQPIRRETTARSPQPVPARPRRRALLAAAAIALLALGACAEFHPSLQSTQMVVTGDRHFVGIALAP